MKIVFPLPNGGIAIIHPTEEALATQNIHEIARRDVPKGLPYKVIQDDVIPSDRTFRDAWEMDVALMTDGVGA